ncbi:MAG: hypothetical protein EOO93_24430 [Pedobacter sp.]|nr:MAG: hypothetical protein EOO93_24430 [Pedobacter sp.]
MTHFFLSKYIQRHFFTRNAPCCIAIKKTILILPFCLFFNLHPAQIFLKFYEGLSNDEIAKVMEIERQTVSNFIYRAIGQLKNDLPSFSNVIPQIILIFFLKFLS